MINDLRFLANQLRDLAGIALNARHFPLCAVDCNPYFCATCARDWILNKIPKELEEIARNCKNVNPE